MARWLKRLDSKMDEVFLVFTSLLPLTCWWRRFWATFAKSLLVLLVLKAQAILSSTSLTFALLKVVACHLIAVGLACRRFGPRIHGLGQGSRPLDFVRNLGSSRTAQVLLHFSLGLEAHSVLESFRWTAGLPGAVLGCWEGTSWVCTATFVGRLRLLWTPHALGVCWHWLGRCWEVPFLVCMLGNTRLLVAAAALLGLGGALVLRWLLSEDCERSILVLRVGRPPLREPTAWAVCLVSQWIVPLATTADWERVVEELGEPERVVEDWDEFHRLVGQLGRGSFWNAVHDATEAA